MTSAPKDRLVRAGGGAAAGVAMAVVTGSTPIGVLWWPASARCSGGAVAARRRRGDGERREPMADRRPERNHCHEHRELDHLDHRDRDRHGDRAARVPHEAMTPAGLPSISEITVSAERAGPYGITAGPDGALWVTLVHTAHRTTHRRRSAEAPALDSPACGPTVITTGPDGALWFTGPGPRVGRITLDGRTQSFPVPTPEAGPFGITAGPDGAMWFTEMNTNRIGRITGDGEITEFTLPVEGGFPSAITAGPTARCGSPSTRRTRSAASPLDGDVTVHPLPTPGAGPVGITSDGTACGSSRSARGRSAGSRRQARSRSSRFPTGRPDPTPSPRRRRRLLVHRVGSQPRRPRHRERRDHGVRPAVAGIRTARHHPGSRRRALDGPGDGRGGEGGAVAPDRWQVGVGATAAAELLVAVEPGDGCSAPSPGAPGIGPGERPTPRPGRVPDARGHARRTPTWCRPRPREPLSGRGAPCSANNALTTASSWATGRRRAPFPNMSLPL